MTTNTNHTSKSKDNELYDDLKNIQNKVKETGQAISQTAWDVKDRASEMLHNSYDNVKERSIEMQEDVVTYIQENPLKAVLYAALSGIAFSLLVRK